MAGDGSAVDPDLCATCLADGERLAEEFLSTVPLCAYPGCEGIRANGATDLCGWHEYLRSEGRLQRGGRHAAVDH